MVAIKDMKMPKDCKKCSLMGTDGRDIFSPMICMAIWATTHEIKHCIGGKMRDDCPLVEIEERKVGKWINKSHKSGCGILFVASECTCCRKKIPFNCDEFLYNYCPNCGAKMDKE